MNGAVDSPLGAQVELLLARCAGASVLLRGQADGTREKAGKGSVTRCCSLLVSPVYPSFPDFWGSRGGSCPAEFSLDPKMMDPTKRVRTHFPVSPL